MIYTEFLINFLHNIILFKMKIYLVSIFPEIYKSFLNTSLISKSIQNSLLSYELVNPRDFCKDKHKQVDDEIYGWWKWMLIKAQPMIDSIKFIFKKVVWSYKILFLSPSKNVFDQKKAFEFCEIDNLILICWRYEWIDHRFELYLQDTYKLNYEKISIWRYVLMGWELASMIVIESVCRLVPWVIKESESYMNESYSLDNNMNNLEYPQYTRPQQVEWYDVPPVLLSWDDKKIHQWKTQNKTTFDLNL